MKRKITAKDRKRKEESVKSLVLRPWRKATDDELMKKINQLENKTSEVEKTKQELEEKNKLLQETETDLENMTKREKEREGLLENMTSELETSIRQLESLEKELQDRNSQLQDLRTQLQEQGRELEERDRQLEERNRQLEERERQLEQRNRQLEEREREQLTDPGPPPIRRSGSNDNDFLRPNMGGESPGPAPPVSPAVSELRLVLLGGSTAGKRAAGNTILGTEEFGRQASTLTHTSTETQHSESRQGEVAGRRVTVVETPDWFCSGLSEKDLRQDVGLCVRLSAPGPHAFLLVIPVEPSEGEEMRMLEKMEDMFGEGCWGHTLILFTNAEGLGERSVEELLQTGSQELQQLVEKCGNRCHLLNVKDRPDDTKITQLLQKIDEIVSGKRDRFYSSQTYQEAEKQVRKIERRIQQEQEVEERKLMEEIEKRKELDEKRESDIQQLEGEIRILNERTTVMESKMEEERDEEEKE
ncbi:GTPase IMAP family member 4-like [Clupea harengus]|uniref:GTPase IMAP family member 4-like n=1 Tax=Clupea harengus TaxID=7950 RepID=A0A6P8GAT7_CLUHA|nr:GTPase IMAP family member 4-like [Clupea harengus]